MWKLFLGQNCVLATGGSIKSAKCMFPFYYLGEKYNDCTMADETKKWCKTDDVGNGNWGYCGEACGNFLSTLYSKILISDKNIHFVLILEYY